jgi:aminopeptidase N
MTLHALRLTIGDDAFFRLLRRWIRQQAGGNATIPEFIALAEQISRQELDAFFDEWLFTPAKPASLDALAATARTSSAAAGGALASAARKGVGPRR